MAWAFPQFLFPSSLMTPPLEGEDHYIAVEQQ